MRDDKDRGLYEKFRVRRTDGRSNKGQKHHGCEYFVLDLNHDKMAVFALREYARQAHLNGYDKLGDDLDKKVFQLSNRMTP